MQWSGSTPPDPTNWDTITYTYDPGGRRIKKNVVGSHIVKYVYDGGNVIAEYGDSNLLRKYIYGARVDEPVCMIDVADSNAAYYYHFDGLGSVMALSDSTGEVVEQYVYDVFGQPALQGSPGTFGNTQVFSSTTTVADRRAMPYTMPEKGNIQSICIYHEGGTGNLLLAVYNDNGSGKPGTRLGVTESTSINGSAGWQTVELTSPVDVAEGQTIWLAWVFSNNPGIRYTTGSPGRAASGVGWSGGMPGSFGSSTTSSYIYSIYANYTSTGLIGNPYMFTGRRFDIETGLYYYRARYYNPHIGRFMQTDPIGYGDGINWYLYCRNNPLAFVDPSGLTQKVTGKYWVLPNYNDPDTGTFWNGVRTVLRGMINKVDEIIPGAPDLGKATEKLEKMATEVGKEVQGLWRAFIEVYDVCDVNLNGIIDANEITGDTYWIEVTGIGSGGEKAPTKYDPTGGWKGDHYDTSGDAMDAAGTAIDWAQKVWKGKQPSIAGVIPEDTTRLNVYLDHGDPYGSVRYLELD